MTLTIVLHMFDNATGAYVDRELPIASCASSDEVIDIARGHAELEDLILTHIRATSPFVTSWQPVQVFRQRVHREFRLRRIGEYAAQATEAMEGLRMEAERIGTVFHQFMERARESMLFSATTPPPLLRNDPTPPSATGAPRVLWSGLDGATWLLGGPPIANSAPTPPLDRTRCTLELFNRPLAHMTRDAANAMRAALRDDQLDGCDACTAYQRGQRNMNRPWINHRLDGR